MRLFTALPLPAPTVAHLEKIQQTLRKNPSLDKDLSWTRPENLHVTLKFLGEIDEKHLPNLIAALRKIHMPPMMLTVDRFLCLPSKGPVRVLAAALKGELRAITALFEKLEPTVQPLGVAREGREYKPHVTLARVKRPSLKHTPQTLSRLVDPFLLPTPSFTVERFALYESTLTPDGPIYRELASVPQVPSVAPKGA